MFHTVEVKRLWNGFQRNAENRGIEEENALTATMTYRQAKTLSMAIFEGLPLIVAVKAESRI